MYMTVIFTGLVTSVELTIIFKQFKLHYQKSVKIFDKNQIDKGNVIL